MKLDASLNHSAPKAATGTTPGIICGPLLGGPSPIEQARQVLRRLESEAKRNRLMLERYDPAILAELVYRHVELRLRECAPGEALTVEIYETIERIGVDRSMLRQRPDFYECVCIGVLVALGFQRGTRGKITVYRRQVSVPSAECTCRLSAGHTVNIQPAREPLTTRDGYAASRAQVPRGRAAMASTVQQSARQAESSLEAGIRACLYELEQCVPLRQKYCAPLDEVQLREVLERAGYTADRQTNALVKKAGAIMRALGWTVRRTSLPGRPRVYVRPAGEAPAMAGASPSNGVPSATQHGRGR